MVTLSLGNKKKTYRSIKDAAKDIGIPYMTLYMRVRMGMKPKQALTKPVRLYTKKAMEINT